MDILTDYRNLNRPCIAPVYPLGYCTWKPQVLNIAWQPTADGKREVWIQFKRVAPWPTNWFGKNSLPGFYAYDPEKTGTSSFSFRGVNIVIDFKEHTYLPNSTKPIYPENLWGSFAAMIQPDKTSTTSVVVGSNGLYRTLFDRKNRTFTVQKNVSETWTALHVIQATQSLIPARFKLPDDGPRYDFYPDYHYPTHPSADWDPIRERLYVSAYHVSPGASDAVILVWPKSDRVWRFAKHPVPQEYGWRSYILVAAEHGKLYAVTNLKEAYVETSLIDDPQFDMGRGGLLEEGDFFEADLSIVDNAALPIY